MIETQTYVSRENRSAKRPILREALMGIDWLALRASAVYYGFGVPRGDGSAVILVPGFLGTDYYMAELYFWLWRVGYNPYKSNIGWNANCLDKLGKRLVETVERANDRTGKPVHLIGHSLGGILSRSAATLKPESVASVITLGSPFRGIKSHPWVLEMGKQVRKRIVLENPVEQPECFTGFCNCETIKAWTSPFPKEVKQTAVFTKTDGIVDWKVCQDGNSDNDFEVSGTHIGLVFNPQVYRIIGKRLAKKNSN